MVKLEPAEPALGPGLKALAERQLAHYRELAAAARPPPDAKPADIKAWEDARKAAVQHLQALLRAMQLAGADAPKEAGDDLADLIAAAVKDAEGGEADP